MTKPVKTMDDFLKARQLPQGSVSLCMRPDVLAEIAELERQIETLQNSDDADDPRMAVRTTETAADLADRIRALEAEAAEYNMDLRLTGVSRLRWNKAKDAATSKDDEGTEKLDLNGLMEGLFAESLVSPEMTEGQRTDFLNGLTEGQWEKVIQTMWDLNRGGASVPKSMRASLALRTKSGKPEPDAQ
jgi:hypothetical protein